MGRAWGGRGLRAGLEMCVSPPHPEGRTQQALHTRAHRKTEVRRACLPALVLNQPFTSERLPLPGLNPSSSPRACGTVRCLSGSSSSTHGVGSPPRVGGPSPRAAPLPSTPKFRSLQGGLGIPPGTDTGREPQRRAHLKLGPRAAPTQAQMGAGQVPEARGRGAQQQRVGTGRRAVTRWAGRDVPCAGHNAVTELLSSGLGL